MGNALVRATIEEVTVKFNGDPKDEKLANSVKKRRQELVDAQNRHAQEVAKHGQSKKAQELQREIDTLAALLFTENARLEANDNVIAAALAYPRSGSSQALMTRLANLKSGKPWQPKSQSFFDRVLFKEEIQGETRLVITISDKDPKSDIARFFRGVAAALFSTLSGGVVGSLSGVVTAATAGELQGLLGEKIKGDSTKEKVTMIAMSKEVDIRIDGHGDLHVTNADGKWIEYDKANSILTLKLQAPENLKTGKALKNINMIKKGKNNGSIVLQLDSEKR